MVEVIVDSILASMLSEHRLLILKETNGDRYLPIWIGRYEADAIAVGLRPAAVPRPLTHDLLGNIISDLGGEISRVEIYDLAYDTFYSHVVIVVMGAEVLKADARPSDAIALAVRFNAPILVKEEVMAQAGIAPEADISGQGDAALAAFRDFINSLDLDDLTV